MEKITSRKNQNIVRIRQLEKDARFRNEQGEYMLDGLKLLTEAISAGAEVTSVFWKNEADAVEGLRCALQYELSAELFDFISPMENSPGPVFTVRMQRSDTSKPAGRVIVLENVQDPGNVGTVLRTACAMGIDAVILTGDCADIYSPKAARATMGAIFRQRVMKVSCEELKPVLNAWGLRLYGAVLSPEAKNVLTTDVTHCAVAIGNEGNGLSKAVRALCDGELIIPMEPFSESLNAAVAASIFMWEMRGRTI